MTNNKAAYRKTACAAFMTDAILSGRKTIWFWFFLTIMVTCVVAYRLLPFYGR